MVTIVFAAEIELPKSLGHTMKSMNKKLNSISLQKADSTKNLISATLADDFVILTLHSKKFTPDSILELPEAFRANDNAHAAEIMNQLKNSKKEGHTKYK